MSFEAVILEPAGNATRQETVGLYALPFNATMENSGDRLQALTDNIGFPLIVSDLYCQDRRTIFDMSARAANQPRGTVYQAMSKRRNDFFAAQAEQFGTATRLGIGDSVSVAAIQGMQLYSEDTPAFDALLLRDGWNLDAAGDRMLTGVARYVGYMARDALHQKKRTEQFDIPGDYWEKRAAGTKSETNLRKKMSNVSDVLRSPENRQNALRLAVLAGKASFAMQVVLLQNGLSGSLDQEEQFAAKLTEAYTCNSADTTSHFTAKVVPGWHSDLLDPVRGAQDVRTTLQLL